MAMNVLSPADCSRQMQQPTVRGATSADAVADGRRGLRRAEDQTPGSRVQSRGGSNTLALPAGTRSAQEPEASVRSTTEAARGHIDEL